MAADSTVSPTWEQLLGKDNWEGLLEPPMNLELRKFILKCGNLAEATYDAMDNDPNSGQSGNSLYDKDSLLRDVVLKDHDHYEVVSFLYAASGIESLDSPDPRPPDARDVISNWMGFVAVTKDQVSTERREIYVAWRGTARFSEWESNLLGSNPVSVKPLLIPQSNWDDATGPKVHSGFLSIYTSKMGGYSFVMDSAREQLTSVIKKLKQKYQGEKLSIVTTGHSMGGALAILSAFDLVENGITDIPVTAVVFGTPKVGNQAFMNRIENHEPKLKILHVRADEDKVPGLPLNASYVPIQTKNLQVIVKKSPYLQTVLHLKSFHNLEVLLHVVAGWSGPNNEFKLYVKRSFALVNKWTGALWTAYGIPSSWWKDRKNKMVYNNDSDEWTPRSKTTN